MSSSSSVTSESAVLLSRVASFAFGFEPALRFAPAMPPLAARLPLPPFATGCPVNCAQVI